MEYGNGEQNQLVWKTIDNRYHNVEFDVDEDNPNVNVAVLSKYVSEGDRILDVGCGEGKFGKIIKKKNCTIIGIDLDKEAGEYAKENNGYSNVLYCNIEKEEVVNEEIKNYLNNKFDKIALIDILEHVINPTQVIYNVIKVLKNEGKILISVPNVNNADIFANLLKDNFNYREAGVLDNTHTKYFTKTSFVQWIKEINDLNSWSLDCEYVGSIFGYTNFMNELKEKRPNLYNFLQLNPYFNVIQHMYILTFYNENGRINNLKNLLSEKNNDLTDNLDKLLDQSNDKNQLFDIKIIKNERKILEEKFDVAQKGWEECSNALNDAKEYIKVKEKDILELKEYINEKNKYIIKLEGDIKELSEALSNKQKEIENVLKNKSELLIEKNKIELELYEEKNKQWYKKIIKNNKK